MDGNSNYSKNYRVKKNLKKKSKKKIIHMSMRNEMFSNVKYEKQSQGKIATWKFSNKLGFKTGLQNI